MTPSERAVAIISIHNQHAARIYAGTKQFEFRRVQIRVKTPCRFLIYETSPVQKITGVMLVGRVLTGTASELLDLERDVEERSSLQRYLTGASKPSALAIERAWRFDRPIPLNEVGVAQAPQSYQFLKSG